MSDIAIQVEGLSKKYTIGTAKSGSFREYISQLSEHLFWDVDRNTLHPEQSVSFIISRVLEYGLFSDWKATIAYYGIDTIKKASLRLRNIDTKSLHFLSTIFDLPKESFRCYTEKQSAQSFWIS